jgi:nucleoside-diphosphate-sugar epimerase
VLPAFVYGPFAPSHVISDISSLSTNGWIYQLLSGTYPGNLGQRAVDIRDVARSAVLSLSANERKPGEQRRIILYGGSFTWEEAVRHIAHVRPDLKSRLVDGGNAAVPEEDLRPRARFDTSKAKDVLGLPKFIDWKQMVEDTVDSILTREGSWAI